MIHVETNNLQAIGYDESQGILYIEFKHSDIYQYYGVDKSIHDGLSYADSKDKYFDKMIKKAGYTYARV